jgi:DNA-binding transcriptional LysR family regulator
VGQQCAVLARSALAAPGVELHFKRLTTLFEVPQGQLESGVLDCAIGLFPQPMTPQSSLHSQILGHDDWVCVARRGHPELRRKLSLKTFAGMQHLSIVYPDVSSGAGMMDRYLAARGLTRNVAAALAHIMTVPFHVARTDCIGTVPRRVALFFSKVLPLQVVEVPPAVQPINIGLVWHARVNGDAAHRWLRQMITDAFQTPTHRRP